MTALADLAFAVHDWGHCRIVSGHMVAIHLKLAGMRVVRPTADADLAAATVILDNDEFAKRLELLGYKKVDGSRLSRPTKHARAVIDLLAPTPASRALQQQTCGALHRRPISWHPVRVERTTPPRRHPRRTARGRTLRAVQRRRAHSPAALVLKTLAALTSARDKDRADVHLLLEAAQATGAVLPGPPYQNRDVERTAEYLHGPFLDEASQQTRALVDAVVPWPPAPPTFTDL